MSKQIETKVIDGKVFYSLGHQFLTQHTVIAMVSESEYLAVKAISDKCGFSVDLVIAGVFARAIRSIVDGEK